MKEEEKGTGFAKVVTLQGKNLGLVKSSRCVRVTLIKASGQPSSSQGEGGGGEDEGEELTKRSVASRQLLVNFSDQRLDESRPGPVHKSSFFGVLLLLRDFEVDEGIILNLISFNTLIAERESSGVSCRAMNPGLFLGISCSFCFLFFYFYASVFFLIVFDNVHFRCQIVRLEAFVAFPSNIDHSENLQRGP